MANPAVTSDPLVLATWQRDLPTVADRLADDPTTDGDLRRRAASAAAACARIGHHADELQLDVVARLAAAGLDARPAGEPGPRQNHDVTVLVESPAAADAAAHVLTESGFETWERWRRGALASFHRHGTHRTVARTGDVSSVVRLRWRTEGHRSALGRAITPTTADWGLVEAPTRAWWIYPPIRVARLASERLRGRPPQRHLGPFLATPASLIDPLLDLARIDEDDVVVDLGCGDGRLIAAAAGRRGCSGIGVEADDDLVERARHRIEAAALGERVRVEHGDARSLDLAGATVLLLFLPLDVVAQLLPGLLGRLSPGARVVAHEQSRLPSGFPIAPERSELLVGDDAVTVGHRWTA